MAVIQVSGDPNAGGGGFQLVPEGSYDLRIDSKKLTTSKASGTPQHELKMTVIASDNGQAIGKSVTYWLSHHPNMVRALREFLDAAGVAWTEQPGPNGPITVWDDDHLVSKLIRGVCGRREYQGKPQEDWKNWQPSLYGQQQRAAASAPAAGAPQGYAQPPAAQPPQGYTPQAVPGQQPGQGATPPVAQPYGVPPQGMPPQGQGR